MSIRKKIEDYKPGVIFQLGKIRMRVKRATNGCSGCYFNDLCFLAYLNGLDKTLSDFIPDCGSSQKTDIIFVKEDEK